MHSPLFSLEVFPPKRDAAEGTIYQTLDGLQGINPDYVSVTYGTGQSTDRTATARIARTITQEYGLPAVAHLTAMYSDQAAVDQALTLFRRAGVTSVLALRGDAVAGRQPAGAFAHASDLAAYIRQQAPGLTLFGACYPEGHPQAASLAEDVENLRAKVDAGVSHLISQLFYTNQDFLDFLDLARGQGITVPIEAGIMPPIFAKSTRRMAGQCGARIPAELDELLNRWQGDSASLRQAGIDYASGQIAELLAAGVDGIHLYSMNHPDVVQAIWAQVGGLFRPSRA